MLCTRAIFSSYPEHTPTHSQKHTPKVGTFPMCDEL